MKYGPLEQWVSNNGSYKLGSEDIRDNARHDSLIIAEEENA